MSASARILGVDPGFANLGYSVCQIDRSGKLTLQALGVIRTTKSSKKTRTLASEDNIRRAREIAHDLMEIVGRWQPKVICAEAMSFPRNSGAAAKVAMAWGIVAAILAKEALPLVQPSPQAVKKAVCGKASASKEEVQRAMERAHRLPRFLSGIPKGLHEHPIDSLAVIHASLESDVILAIVSSLDED